MSCCFALRSVRYNDQETSDANLHQQHQQLQSSFSAHPADLSIPPAWQGRSVAGPKLRLVNMAAFVEFTLPVDMFTDNAVRIPRQTLPMMFLLVIFVQLKLKCSGVLNAHYSCCSLLTCNINLFGQEFV